MSVDEFYIYVLGHGDPDLECNKCGKVFASKFTLRAHRKIHNRKFPCKHCTRSYLRLEDMRAHMVKKHFMFICDHCDYITEEYADLKTHQQTHKTTYKDSSETELDHSLFNDVTNNSDVMHSPERDWKLERVDNLDQENQHSDDFQDDESDIIIRHPRGIQGSEDMRFSQGKIRVETNPNQEECYEDGSGDSVIAKVMSNKAFLAKKNKRYSKVG